MTAPVASPSHQVSQMSPASSQGHAQARHADGRTHDRSEQPGEAHERKRVPGALERAGAAGVPGDQGTAEDRLERVPDGDRRRRRQRPRGREVHEERAGEDGREHADAREQHAGHRDPRRGPGGRRTRMHEGQGQPDPAGDEVRGQHNPEPDQIAPDESCSPCWPSIATPRDVPRPADPVAELRAAPSSRRRHGPHVVPGHLDRPFLCVEDRDGSRGVTNLGGGVGSQARPGGVNARRGARRGNPRRRRDDWTLSGARRIPSRWRVRRQVRSRARGPRSAGRTDRTGTA